MENTINISGRTDSAGGPRDVNTIGQVASTGSSVVPAGQTSSTAGVSVVKTQPRGIRLMRDVTAEIVADRIIDFCNEHGDWVTNLKLQKLLYYTQAWYLALYDGPLFDEPIIATPNGPIQKEVLVRYQRYGHGPIDQPSGGQKVPKKLDSHIVDVMEAYGHLSAFDLENLSRDEEPWKLAQNRDDGEKVISQEVMKAFYRMRLDEKRAKR
jgi:uncharacterized phage-associated protein